MVTEFKNSFKSELVEHGRTALPVYVSLNDGKPIILVHELPEMTPLFVDYCLQMSKQGYKVYAPQMFNNVASEMNSLQMAAFCVTKEFRDLYWRNRTGEESEFSTWLLHLAGIVSERHQNQKLAVIGMCLTGAFVLITFAEPRVNAVVCCQPAFPFKLDIESLGMTTQHREDIFNGAKALGEGCAIGFRYADDHLSRPNHIEAIQQLLNQPSEHGGEITQRFIYIEKQGSGHPTVTLSPPDAEGIQEINDFLYNRIWLRGKEH